jgi:hypothetical protein
MTSATRVGFARLTRKKRARVSVDKFSFRRSSCLGTWIPRIWFALVARYLLEQIEGVKFMHVLSAISADRPFDASTGAKSPVLASAFPIRFSTTLAGASRAPVGAY